MVKSHTSNIRMIYKYIRVRYGWHTSTYEWHTDDIRLHMSDIRMTYEYIRVTYGWHTSTCEWHTDDIRTHTSDIRTTYEWHTDDIRVTYEWYTSTYDWHENDIRNIKLYNGFGAFISLFFKTICVKNTALCRSKRFLVTRLFLFSYVLLEYSWVQLQGLETWIIWKEARIISCIQVQR